MLANTWHSETIARFKTLSIEALEYIKLDAHKAATIGDTIENPKASQYWDEYHYACMELNRRKV